MIYFTADLHLGHKKIIKFDGRPYASTEEMDWKLIDNWNQTVRPEDSIYVLGDVSWVNGAKTEVYLKQLMGNKYLIRGNHDQKHRTLYERYFIWVKDLHTLKVPDETAPEGRQKIVLCHYAMKVWDSSHYGAWQLYGHSHGSLENDPYAAQLDVGVPCQDYHPISYDELRRQMTQKIWRPKDRHGSTRRSVP